jgi:hypothetical protein
MSLSPRRTAAVAMAFAVIAAAAAANAVAYTPPKGIPDLSRMTLQASDLGRGATPLVSEYFDPAGNQQVLAEYDRDWGAVSTTGNVKLQQLQTVITLLASTKWSQTVFGQLSSVYGGSAGRTTLIADVDSANGSSASIKDSRFSNLRSIGIGQESLYESATIAFKGSTLVAGFAWVRVNTAMAFLVVVAPKPPLADAVTIALAKAVAAHMTSVFAAR